MLVAVDGSWRQAKAMVRRNLISFSKLCTPVTVSGHPPAVFGRLKREPAPELLSTAEAVGAAVSVRVIF